MSYCVRAKFQSVAIGNWLISSRADVKKMFEKCVNGTIDLISRQVVQVQINSRRETSGTVTVSPWYLCITHLKS